jgi:hypothetical protein
MLFIDSHVEWCGCVCSASLAPFSLLVFFFKYFFLRSFLASCHRVFDVGRPSKYFSSSEAAPTLGPQNNWGDLYLDESFQPTTWKIISIAQPKEKHSCLCLFHTIVRLAFRCPLVCVCHGQEPNSRPPGSTILASAGMKMPSTDPPCGARPSRHSNLLQPNRPLIG